MAISDKCIKTRLEKLRQLREQLCSKETDRHDAFKSRNWLLNEIVKIEKFTNSESSTKKEIAKQLNKLINELNINKGEANE